MSLVYGGTFTMDNGNRAIEDAIVLKPVSLERQRLFEQQVKVSRDLTDLRDTLVRLADDGINIVGSRGYVYGSKLLARLILSDGLKGAPNLLPRTFGLRLKYMELAGFELTELERVIHGSAVMK